MHGGRRKVGDEVIVEVTAGKWLETWWWMCKACDMISA